MYRWCSPPICGHAITLSISGVRWDHDTLRRSVGDGVVFYCLTDGALNRLDHTIERICIVRAGTVVREFESAEDGFLLVPSTLSESERAELVNTLIDEAQGQEEEA